jgi:hypothetical protein
VYCMCVCVCVRVIDSLDWFERDVSAVKNGIMGNLTSVRVVVEVCMCICVYLCVCVCMHVLCVQ